jgi:hypothetical protein
MAWPGAGIMLRYYAFDSARLSTVRISSRYDTHRCAVVIFANVQVLRGVRTRPSVPIDMKPFPSPPRQQEADFVAKA